MPWPDEPCQSCPRVLAGLPLPCKAQVTKHQRFCELGDPESLAYSPEYAAMLKGDAEPKVEPSPFRQALNYGKAIVRRQAEDPDKRDVSDAEHARRLAICRLCEFHIASLDKCSKCGCTLMEKKARWATESCPVGKWEAPTEIQPSPEINQ